MGADRLVPDDFDNPETAKQALEVIMKAFPKSKSLQYIGDFNQIAVYLDRRVAEWKSGKKAK
jgi:hypothetical protein